MNKERYLETVEHLPDPIAGDRWYLFWSDGKMEEITSAHDLQVTLEQARFCQQSESKLHRV